ncbi:class II fructose-bisphosphate aldolase [Thiococcus pfennigii]|uniref:class II fructose-bisphosphate aldolase n=1 Tax=Thiococcus pfennigii TaxID=1057 RepID=UPI00190443A5|nr:class II fructose-bisphosphate aldolase [Thiococcus pfennigii]MBK1699611.1 fructose-bisphosphate aldolase [Thiococcus pfennigii]MBK1731786.1 fructose-bisphosphate aldolase [Thiococcus pfennigii]
MPLVNMKDMLDHAYAHGYAVGAFDLVGLDFLEAIITGAERSRAPVILGLAESHFDHFDFELAMPAVEAAARRARVPVAIHLDHGANLESAVRAIRLGANGVMVDASHLRIGDNVAITRGVVEMAHGCGVCVEGELGYVPGAAGEEAERHPGPVQYTTVAEARAYAERTGVDCLAVSIGTLHGRRADRPRLDWARLKELNAALGLPLVIHGGSGLTDDQYRKLVTLGVAKINYYTALADAAGEAIRAAAKAGGRSYTALLGGVREAIAAEVERCLRVWGAAGRAAEVSDRCRPWLNVEHVVAYNAPRLDEAGVRALMAEGQRALATIPGVRGVSVGSVADAPARYRHCWLIRLAAPEAIERYRRHPAQIAFVERLFRPAAADRLSADYRIADRHSETAALPLPRVPSTEAVAS